jgi:hypothetical protein
LLKSRKDPVTALANNKRFKALNSAPGDSWVILSDDQSTVLISGNSFEEVAKKAEDLGLSEDFPIIKTPASWSPLSV